jgi:hypothetical protein
MMGNIVGALIAILTVVVSSTRVKTNAPTRRKRKKRKKPEDRAGDFKNGRQIMSVK